ncbi:response regulator [Desulfococcaceae bacterium HSG9]|nr:response regulator [Desulfococcaceae bacterium HSG9]
MTVKNKEITRILIVDDVPDSIRLLGNILQQEGYQINGAKDGLQALEIAAKIIPDLILLDVMMPEPDGFETCQRLKDNPVTKDIPIIFLTSMGQVKDMVKGFQVGAADYITKPFNTLELLVRIQTHLELKKAEKERLQKEKLKSILELAGAVCHELVQPMQTISGLSEILLFRIDKDDPNNEKISEIRRQVKRMVKIIKKLRSITKYETKYYAGKSKIIDIAKSGS